MMDSRTKAALCILRRAGIKATVIYEGDGSTWLNKAKQTARAMTRRAILDSPQTQRSNRAW